MDLFTLSKCKYQTFEIFQNELTSRDYSWLPLATKQKVVKGRTTGSQGLGYLWATPHI